MEEILMQIGYVRIMLLLVILTILLSALLLSSDLTKILKELKKLNGKKNAPTKEGEIKP